MKFNKKTSLFIAILICTTLFFDGPFKPIFVFANLDSAILNSDNSSSIDEPEIQEEASPAPTKPQQAEVVSQGNPASKYQKEIDKITERLKNLQSEKKNIEQSINAAKTVKEKELANKNYLDKQITNTKDEIELLHDRISLLEEDILAKEEDITKKQSEIDQNYEQFKKRLRAMQLSDDVSSLGLILGSDDFADFLSRTETVSRIALHDRTLMQNLTEQRILLEESKSELENSHKLVIKDKEETELKKQNLNVQLSAAAAAVYSAASMEKEFLADLAENKSQTAQMEKDISDIYKQIEWDKNPYVGGEMAWPVPGFYKVSSAYGWRFGGSDFHTGMDIAGSGIYGSKIVAANAGTVKLTNWSYTPGRGYGIYLLIDHGGNTSTLYGHCKSISVKVGDVVKKGQAIAEVGSTGWSTGPHLHFEVRKNGAHVNPQPFVTGK